MENQDTLTLSLREIEAVVSRQVAAMADTCDLLHTLGPAYTQLDILSRLVDGMGKKANNGIAAYYHSLFAALKAWVSSQAHNPIYQDNRATTIETGQEEPTQDTDTPFVWTHEDICRLYFAKLLVANGTLNEGE